MGQALSPHKAGEIVIESIMTMAQDGRPLMQRILPDDRPLFWEHYPDDDARDRKTMSRWYYHVHPAGSRDAEEHGHFHLFLHQTQLDDPSSEWSEPASKSKKRANVLHVAGLSIDLNGIPRGWFVANRWVTDEWLYPSEKIIPHLDDFNVDDTPEDVAVNRFLTAMVALYRDEITALIRQRDVKFADAGISKETPDGWEDRDIEILGWHPIDLDEKLEAIGLLDE